MYIIPTVVGKRVSGKSGSTIRISTVVGCNEYVYQYEIEAIRILLWDILKYPTL